MKIQFSRKTFWPSTVQARAARTPVKDKQRLVADLRMAVGGATTSCATHPVILPAIELLAAGSLARWQRIPELSTEERAEVKKVGRDLLNRLQQLRVLNWRQKVAARAQLKLAIEDVLANPDTSRGWWSSS